MRPRKQLKQPACSEVQVEDDTRLVPSFGLSLALQFCKLARVCRAACTLPQSDRSYLVTYGTTGNKMSQLLPLNLGSIVLPTFDLLGIGCEWSNFQPTDPPKAPFSSYLEALTQD